MIPLYRPPLAGRLAESINQTMRSCWWGYGPICNALERRFVDAHGGNAIALTSGTTALHTAARLLVATPGDEVIVPAMTYVSTAMAFHEAGFNVRVADVDPETLLITSSTVKPLLSARTRAIVAVHLYGQRADLKELAALSAQTGAALIEDRAHRIGLSDPPVGDFACYSFNVLKEAPAGDGGLLWFRDVRHLNRVMSLTNVGLSSDTWERTREIQHGRYTFDGLSGLKLRLNDVSATFVLAALDSFPTWEVRRRHILESYRDRCRDAEGDLRVRPVSDGDSHLMAVLRVPGFRRDAFRALLQAEGVSTSIHYPALSGHPLFPGTDCPHAELAAHEVVSIPLFPDLPEDSVAHVGAAVVQSWMAIRNGSPGPA